MTDYITATITDPRSGRVMTGQLWESAASLDLIPPTSIGMSPKPEEYGLFSTIAPAVPAFARVFSPPGKGLPKLDSAAVRNLPAGTLPWLSWKDSVPTAQIAALLDEIRDQYNPPTGRRIRVTVKHERAPGSKADRDEYFRDWETLVDVAQGRPWIEPVQIQTNYAMRFRRDTKARDWIIPGVSLGFDVYAARFGKDAPYEPVESTFGLLVELATEFGCPSFGCPELSADAVNGTPEEQAEWLREAVAYLIRKRAAFIGLWASHERRGDVYYDYRPNTPQMIAAYRSIFGSDE